MDLDTGDMPLTSDLWMTQHGFTMKEGEKKWHDLKSEEEKITRIEERDESEGQEVLSSEVILSEILGAKSGHFRGRGSGHIATRKGTMSTPHSELGTQLKTTVSELTDQLKDNQTQLKDNQALLKENQEKMPWLMEQIQALQGQAQARQNCSVVQEQGNAGGKD
ncbi:hypothetical protein CRYUN_Cryun13aG0057600 [Craigia yunnanensis]